MSTKPVTASSIGLCTHKEVHAHLHNPDGRKLVHNVPERCPLSKKFITEGSVYCHNIDRVFASAQDLIADFTQRYLERLSLPECGEICVRMHSLKHLSDTSAMVTPALFNRLMLYPLGKPTGVPGHFHLLECTPFSVKEADVLKGPALRLRPERIRDPTITTLITNYLTRKDPDNMRENSILIRAIHNRRETLKLDTVTNEHHLTHGPDLSDLELNRLNICNLNGKYRTFINTNFSGCTFVDCDFRDARFLGCNLENTIFYNCLFSNHNTSFYRTSVAGAAFGKNDFFELEDDKGLLTKTVKTFEDYQEKLESIGALNTSSMKKFEDVFKEV